MPIETEPVPLFDRILPLLLVIAMCLLAAILQ
jgi:hypothetical protein